MSKSFSSHYKLSEEQAVKRLLKALDWDKNDMRAVRMKAGSLVETVREGKRPAGQLESFLQEYSLDTEEGLALMTLAEALLRVPDKETANRLIRDKVAAANWLEGQGGSQDWVVKAAGVGLFMTTRTLDSVFDKVGQPFIRGAMVQAMRVLGQQFVLGRDIEEAMQNAQRHEKRGYRMSYDILGEGARTQIDADRYYESYANAIEYIGARAKGDDPNLCPGMSVKLSALHPRYTLWQEERCVPEMIEKLRALMQLAASHNIACTVDAEESERLDISVKIIEGALADKALNGWRGFGMAVQAYHKAALPLITHMAKKAKAFGGIQMRLVKGAYWDSEIKKAQVEGLESFPVYTRKANTDVSYMACVRKMFEHADVIYPMLATHNAHSIASVIHMAEGQDINYEFQRLFGMGGGLFDQVIADHGKRVSVYAPVGPHEDLLPYLVRRLLENGANTSFVNRLLDPDASVDDLVHDPVDKVRSRAEYQHLKIALPKDIFQDEKPMGRLNSKGVDLYAPEEVEALETAAKDFEGGLIAAPLINGKTIKDGVFEDVFNPARHDHVVGRVYPAHAADVQEAFKICKAGFETWSMTLAHDRAVIFEKAADALEEQTEEFTALLVNEAGKTISDAIAEIREAVDFCRYYAAQGRSVFDENGVKLPGPTGEHNAISLHGRGVFVCISPWNFPLAIFTGQVVAALMAGNTVVAKPAEQTPLVGMKMVELLLKAGLPSNAVSLLPGDGEIGAKMTEHPDVAGVAFTGSTEVAKIINRTLAAKDGPIVPLIAETGGQNAMIVDSSALPEQVIDDVILSAFGSAGQRCSALRILCLQEDCADKMIRMLKGAMLELRVGDTVSIAADIGPVIDEDAKAMLIRHREKMHSIAETIYEVPVDTALEKQGGFFGPCAYEIDDVGLLGREVFGPILHVVRYKKNELPALLETIKNTGYGLTFGIHSRIESFQKEVTAQLPVGNVYINRGITGAIVGSQPFGGTGLSGTGPKAGGPHYLHRFASEKTISIDTTAAGGNASLVSLEE